MYCVMSMLLPTYMCMLLWLMLYAVCVCTHVLMVSSCNLCIYIHMHMLLCLMLYTVFLPVVAGSLDEFDQTMASLSQWCEGKGQSATTLPKVKEIVAIKNENSWMRAKVARQVSDRYVHVCTCILCV